MLQVRNFILLLSLLTGSSSLLKAAASPRCLSAVSFSAQEGESKISRTSQINVLRKNLEKMVANKINFNQLKRMVEYNNKHLKIDLFNKKFLITFARETYLRTMKHKFGENWESLYNDEYTEIIRYVVSQASVETLDALQPHFVRGPYGYNGVVEQGSALTTKEKVPTVLDVAKKYNNPIMVKALEERGALTRKVIQAAWRRALDQDLECQYSSLEHSFED